VLTGGSATACQCVSSAALHVAQMPASVADGGASVELMVVV
jgi:hypothetical protein